MGVYLTELRFIFFLISPWNQMFWPIKAVLLTGHSFYENIYCDPLFVTIPDNHQVLPLNLWTVLFLLITFASPSLPMELCWMQDSVQT